MTKTNGLFFLPGVMAGFLAIAPGVYGQIPQPPGIVYQQAGAFSAQSGAAETIMLLPKMIGPDFMNPDATAGSPFSASQQSHTLQTLGDGTKIERTETSQYYRDSQGRTRVDTGSGTTVIQDPVAGFMATLDTASKTFQKLPAPAMLKNAARVRTGRAVVNEGRNSAERNIVFSDGGFAGGAVTGTAIAGTAVAGVFAGPGLPQSAMVAGAGQVAVTTSGAGAVSTPVVEDLGTQNINGVTAAGRRTTITIATGEIGNDRPIHVTGETWYSSDLQMVVKSSNSDPRFSDTTYELTNVNRAEPDPILFQIPSDYTQAGPKVIQFQAPPAKE
jgi:hypothetical protein